VALQRKSLARILMDADAMKKNIKTLILWGFLPSMVLFFGPALFLEAWGLVGFETITAFLPKSLIDGLVVSGLVYVFFLSALFFLIRFSVDPNRNNNFIVFVIGAVFINFKIFANRNT
jgi:hypothetical protein